MRGPARVIGFPARPRQSVMVCLSFDSRGRVQTLLRKAQRTALELGADWYAVHVDCDLRDKAAVPGRDFHALLDAIVMAADMGAEVIWLKSPDITQALLNFARDARVKRIMLGRGRYPRRGRLRGGSVTAEIIKGGREFEIEVIGLGRGGEGASRGADSTL